MFEGAALLGICDKIVPGLLIGALRFGHLPTILVPAGPMPLGRRQQGKAARPPALRRRQGRPAPSCSRPRPRLSRPGTCTFYGTANSNQMMMEVMGLHMPGAAFVNPGTKLRQELTRAAVHRLAADRLGRQRLSPAGRCVDEKAIVNAAVGLLATGGSTNHVIHLPAIARAAGIVIDWEDIDRAVGRGAADRAGLSQRLGRREPFPRGRRHGLRDPRAARRRAAARRHHDRVGGGIGAYAREPWLDGDGAAPGASRPGSALDETMLRPASAPFQPDGGMRLVQGNLGRAMLQDQRGRSASAGRSRRRAGCSTTRTQVIAAFKAASSTATWSWWCASRARAPTACPSCTSSPRRSACCRIAGYKVALVTDGRMSGASGKVPAAIHVTPEALGGGRIAQAARRRHGPAVRRRRRAQRLVDDAELGRARSCASRPPPQSGTGRELFAMSCATAPTRPKRAARRCWRQGGLVTHELVAVDVGGTHARFAIAELHGDRRPSLSEPRKYRTADYPGLAAAWAAFASDQGGTLPRPRRLAGPVEGELFRVFTNNSWVTAPPRGAGPRTRPRRPLPIQRFRGDGVGGRGDVAGSAISGGPKGLLPVEGVTTVIGGYRPRRRPAAAGKAAISSSQRRAAISFRAARRLRGEAARPPARAASPRVGRAGHRGTGASRYPRHPGDDRGQAIVPLDDAALWQAAARAAPPLRRKRSIGW